MLHHACLFEAKSIQDYILRSGRLRHIVGASELIDSLTSTLLDDVLKALSVQDQEHNDLRFSRRAGGAIYLFTNNEKKCIAFRDLWTLVVRQYAPGLSFIIATGSGTDDFIAYAAAKKQLETMRNRHSAAVPAGTPVTRYAPRTGAPATQGHPKLGLQDEATERFGLDIFWQHGLLTKRFARNSKYNDWPRDLQYDNDLENDSVGFPFQADSRYLGLIHADGNGLGQLLIDLSAYAEKKPQKFVEVFHAFSEAIQTATASAAAAATASVLAKNRTKTNNDLLTAYPARPIVLGGDDLTILIRADLAIPFAQEFLKQFEIFTEQEMTDLRKKYPEITALPKKLTAGAGIAFVKSNHPFYMTMELTEGLAKFAKDRAKEHKIDNCAPPTIAFYRVTTASHGNYREVRDQELTFCGDTHPIVTSLGAYGTEPQPLGLPALADVLKLAELFRKKEVARGPARHLLTLIGQDVDGARRRYSRWREVMKQRAPTTLAQIDALLTKLCGPLDRELPVSAATNQDKAQITPLADLSTLLTLGKVPANLSQGKRDA
jgi:hypothetical protein